MHDKVLPTTLARKQEAKIRDRQFYAKYPKVTQRELVGQLVSRVGRAHRCLASLLGVGLVKINHFKSVTDYTQVI